MATTLYGTGTAVSTSTSTGRTLADLRLRFVQATGRLDLIEDGDLSTNTDNGANAYLSDAQKRLDERVNPIELLRREQVVLATGEAQILIPWLMALKSITIVNSEGTKKDITQEGYSYPEFEQTFPVDIEDTTAAIPTSWCFNPYGLAPDQLAESTSTFASAGVEAYSDISFGQEYRYKAILFNTKADQDYTVRVTGKFYSPWLNDDSEVTYWTYNHPDLLVLAAQQIMEEQLGNMQRVRDLEAAIARGIRRIDHAIIQNEFAGMYRFEEA